MKPNTVISFLCSLVILCRVGCLDVFVNLTDTRGMHTILKISGGIPTAMLSPSRLKPVVKTKGMEIHHMYCFEETNTRPLSELYVRSAGVVCEFTLDIIPTAHVYSTLISGGKLTCEAVGALHGAALVFPFWLGVITDISRGGITPIVPVRKSRPEMIDVYRLLISFIVLACAAIIAVPTAVYIHRRRGGTN